MPAANRMDREKNRDVKDRFISLPQMLGAARLAGKPICIR